MDEHLDTSWCPVCDRMILPKRYTVPIAPISQHPIDLPSQTQMQTQTQTQQQAGAVKQSQTTRGKHGTIKARAQGGGLLHGTGRIRPGGGLRRDSSNGGLPTLAQLGAARKQLSPQKQALAQQQAAAVLAQQQAAAQQAQAQMHPRTRTVIDQAQTPLYCSEECRLADSVWDPPASIAAPVPTSRPRLGVHPSQLNPAQHSPPPPSPVLPPVPPNSWRAPAHANAHARALRMSLSEAEHSDGSESSSATGTSFTASDASASASDAAEVTRNALKKLALLPDGVPAIPDMPPHPHRPSAPAVKPTYAKAPAQPEGGLMMAAHRLQQYFLSGAQKKEKERVEREERERKEKEQQRREREAKEEDERRQRMQSPADWVASTHRHANPAPSSSSAAADSGSTSPSRARSFAASRTQSALELYAKYPLFSKSRASTPARPALAASPTVSTSYTPAYAVSAHSSARGRSVDSAVTSKDQPSNTSTVPSPIFDEDAALYAGKRLSTTTARPRSFLPKGAEGRLLVPDVQLKPYASALGAAAAAPAFRPSSSVPATLGMRRSASGGGVPRLRRTDSEDGARRSAERHSRERSERRGSRNASALGSVKEEVGGVWRVQEQGTEEGSEDSRSEGNASESRKEKRASSRHSSTTTSSKAGLSLPERGRLNMEARNWSYDNIDGPTYDIMPAVPIKQQRFEEIFIPDSVPSSTSSSTTSVPTSSSTSPTNTEPTEPTRPYIAINPTHAHDVELSRREIREVCRRRGVHEGREGTWIELEWEVTAIPERKRLFLFGSGRKVHT